ncbi:hypothetical protein ARMGADRAFT_1067962 [Armillaria gallica]|uniref:Uncharacterized protein n=1 Tax=Armillaria gallica TaxID=47427 RepID=A0A2H3CIS9_ARMGA|nr:hypothetical protein ARMGADRAFT_1067962 [Armillaria gallica]
MTIFHFRCLLLLLSMAQTRAAQDNDEGSNESSNRTTWDIIWSCTATIFACTWLAVHPNVPSRHMREKGRLFLCLHRVKHMLLAIICPEVVIMWAFRQRLVASALSKHLKLSMTHGFFISMGGFIGKNEHPITAADFFYSDISDIARGVIGGEIRPGVDISPILSVTKDELMDRSKGDALSKSISLFQTTWFVVQYFSRVTLSLPTTPLETATLAFALLNFCNYILWWHKPLDVQYPLNVSTIDAMMGLGSETRFELPEPTSRRSGVLEPENPVTSAAESKSNPSGYEYTALGKSSSSPRLPAHNSTTGVLTTNHSDLRTSPSSKHQLSVDYVKNHASESVCSRECLECDISNPVAMSINDWRFFYQDTGLIIDGLSLCRGSDEWSVFHTSTDSIDILPTVAIVSPHAVASTGRALVTNFGKPQRRYWLGFHKYLFTLIPALCVRVWRWYHDIFSKIVSGKGLTDITNATLPMLWAGQMTWCQNIYAACFGACFGALFGGVHCIEWTSSGFFGSFLEHLLWKISSLLVAIVPIILAFEVISVSSITTIRRQYLLDTQEIWTFTWYGEHQLLPESQCLDLDATSILNGMRTAAAEQAFIAISDRLWNADTRVKRPSLAVGVATLLCLQMYNCIVQEGKMLRKRYSRRLEMVKALVEEVKKGEKQECGSGAWAISMGLIQKIEELDQIPLPRTH